MAIVKHVKPLLKFKRTNQKVKREQKYIGLLSDGRSLFIPDLLIKHSDLIWAFIEEIQRKKKQTNSIVKKNNQLHRISFDNYYYCYYYFYLVLEMQRVRALDS